MIDMHSKYDNMHKNVMFYVLIYINNHIIISISCMLSAPKSIIMTMMCAKNQLDKLFVSPLYYLQIKKIVDLKIVSNDL